MVAHHISMVAVQAETARVAVPGMPSAGAERLRAIGDTARSALTEMRRLLGVLREDDRERADLRPQPGLRLTELNALLDEARDASGTAVRLVLSGSPAVLDPGVELAAYRIIQEALTNARRHAPGAAVDVELHYTRDALRLRVRDNGPGIPFSSGTATGTGGSDGLGVPGGAVMPGAAVPSETRACPMAWPVTDSPNTNRLLADRLVAYSPGKNRPVMNQLVTPSPVMDWPITNPPDMRRPGTD